MSKPDDLIRRLVEKMCAGPLVVDGREWWVDRTREPGVVALTLYSPTASSPNAGPVEEEIRVRLSVVEP